MRFTTFPLLTYVFMPMIPYWYTVLLVMFLSKKCQLIILLVGQYDTDLTMAADSHLQKSSKNCSQISIKYGM